MASSGLTTFSTSDPPDLEGLAPDERRELVLEWWGENFEDPAQNTPHDSGEGGYLYIWGGPYDAREELIDAFTLDDDELEDIADEIESEGIYDWAPNSGRVRPEDEDEGTEAPDADDLRSLLTEIRAGLDQLRHSHELTAPPPGLGHNQPPEALAVLTPEDLDEAERAIDTAEAELDQQSPDPSVLAQAGATLQSFASKLRGWIAQVPGLMAKGAVTAVGAYVATRYLNAPEKLADDIVHAGEMLRGFF